MKISPAGIDAIKRHEGLRLFAYRDVAGVWTVGYGHTKTAQEGQHITQSHADYLLQQDLAWVEKCIADSVTVPLTQGQYDACASFIFNLGAGAFKDSTLLRMLNAGDYAGAADQFLRWNKAKINGELRPVDGLSRRRQAERAMFMSGAAPKVDTPPKHVEPVGDPTQFSQEGGMPIPAVAMALLPSLIEAIPKLGALFGSGSDVSKRNQAAAGMALDIVQQATSAVNAQDAIERIKADPVAQAAAAKAVEDNWFQLSEVGGGVAAASKRDIAFVQSGEPVWKSPSFIVALALLPLVYMIVGAVVGVFGDPFSEDVRAAIANGIVGLVLGGLIGYYYGQTTSRNRSTT